MPLYYLKLVLHRGKFLQYLRNMLSLIIFLDFLPFYQIKLTKYKIMLHSRVASPKPTNKVAHKNSKSTHHLQ